MSRQPLIIALAAALLVLGTIAPVATGTALAAADGEDAVTLDPSIPINSADSISAYESEGVVRAGLAAPEMDITIADERDDVGKELTLNPLKGSTRNDFVRVKHRENIGRTVQIPVSADYWNPFPRERLDSLDESHTATLEPVQIDGEQYTLITIEFDGAESAVFPIPEDAIAVYSTAENTEERTNDTLGVELGLTPSPWSTINPEVFTGNSTSVRIEGNPEETMTQYNAGTPAEPEWVPIPDGQRRNVPVYRMQKDGVENAVYVVSATTDPPQVRYKKQATYGDKVGGWVTDAQKLPDRIIGETDVDIPFLTVSSPGVMA